MVTFHGTLIKEGGRKMKKFLYSFLTLIFTFYLVMPVYAKDQSVTISSTSAMANSVSASGTTAAPAVTVQVRSADGNTLIGMATAGVVNGSFSAEVSGLTLSGSTTYSVYVADYEGGNWATATVTTPAAPVTPPVTPPATPGAGLGSSGSSSGSSSSSSSDSSGSSGASVAPATTTVNATPEKKKSTGSKKSSEKKTETVMEDKEAEVSEEVTEMSPAPKEDPIEDTQEVDTQTDVTNEVAAEVDTLAANAKSNSALPIVIATSTIVVAAAGGTIFVLKKKK